MVKRMKTENGMAVQEMGDNVTIEDLEEMMEPDVRALLGTAAHLCRVVAKQEMMEPDGAMWLPSPPHHLPGLAK